MSSKPQSQPTSTTTTTTPWVGQQEDLLRLFQGARRQFDKGGPQYFPGQTVAPQSADTTQSQQMLRSTAGQVQPLTQQAINTSLWNMGEGRDVANNPYLQSAIRAAQQPVIQSFWGPQGPAAGIRSGFTAANSGGSGTREGIAQGVAERGLNQQLVNMSAGMTMDAYNRAQEDSMRSMALMPQTLQGAAYPASLFSQVGAQNDAYAQSLLSADMARWNYNQNLPWLNLQNYQGIVGGGSFGNTQNVSGSVPMPSPNPWMSTLGGAGAGAALGSQMGTAAGPYGTAIGAGLGALVGYFGSR